MLRVATTSIPVPQMSFTTMSPHLTGARTKTENSAFWHSNSLAFGTSPVVITGSRPVRAPVSLIVEVSIRVGAVCSLVAKATPRLHLWPVMISPSYPSSTVIRQEFGQTMQVYSAMAQTSFTLTRISAVPSAWAEKAIISGGAAWVSRFSAMTLPPSSQVSSTLVIGFVTLR